MKKLTKKLFTLLFICSALIQSSISYADYWYKMGKVNNIYIKRTTGAIYFDVENPTSCNNIQIARGKIDEQDNPDYMKRAYTLLLTANTLNKSIEGKVIGCDENFGTANLGELYLTD